MAKTLRTSSQCLSIATQLTSQISIREERAERKAPRVIVTRLQRDDNFVAFTLIGAEEDNTQGNVHEEASSTLDPGRHFASLDVACLLPLHLPRIASHAASCTYVSA